MIAPPTGASLTGQPPRSLRPRLLRRVELLPPLGGLLWPAPRVVEPDDPLQRFAQASLGLFGNLPLALLHLLVALQQQRLGVGVLLLAQQAGAQQALRVEGAPGVRLLLGPDRQAVAQHRLGFGPLGLAQ